MQGPPRIPMPQAWDWQRQRLEQLCAKAGDTRDTLLLLQHPPVYTLGAGSTEAHLRFDPAAPPHPLFRTERGGEVTYHGPGQVGAPLPPPLTPLHFLLVLWPPSH